MDDDFDIPSSDEERPRAKPFSARPLKRSKVVSTASAEAPSAPSRLTASNESRAKQQVPNFQRSLPKTSAQSLGAAKKRVINAPASRTSSRSPTKSTLSQNESTPLHTAGLKAGLPRLSSSSQKNVSSTSKTLDRPNSTPSVFQGNKNSRNPKEVISLSSGSRFEAETPQNASTKDSSHLREPKRAGIDLGWNSAPSQGDHKSRTLKLQRPLQIPAPVGHEAHETPQLSLIPNAISPTRMRAVAETPKKRKLKDRLTANNFPSIGVESTTSDEDFSSTGSSSPSSPSRPRTPPIGEANSQKSQLTVHTPGRMRTTYGGQRSHLASLNSGEDPLLDEPILDDADSKPSVRRTLGFQEERKTSRSPSLDPDSEDDESLQEQQLRNIHELRAAGKMQRVALETDALLEDVRSAGTISLRRSALLRLAQRLLETEFKDEFVRNGLSKSFYGVARVEMDVFSQALFCIAATQILQSGPIADIAPRGPAASILPLCLQALQKPDSLIVASRNRKSNMSRVHQEDLKRFLSSSLAVVSTKESKLEPAQVSARRCSLLCLNAFVRRLRQAGSKDRVLDLAAVSKLAELSAAKPADFDEDPLLAHDWALAVPILESLSVATISDSDSGADLPSPALRNILEMTLGLVSQFRSEDVSTLCLALRLCLNITTVSLENCRGFASVQIISALTVFIKDQFQNLRESTGGGSEDEIIDAVILGVGLLTNITERLDRSRILFVRAMAEGETCLNALIKIFQKQYEDAGTATTERESKINVVFGYLAVTLSCLCQNSVVRELVADGLRDPKLESLRTAVAQFIQMHHTILSAGSDSEAGNRRQTAFVGRMEQILSALNKTSS